MRLIVGLGNPGGKYQSTRHNIGFMVVEKLVKGRLSLYPSLKAWKHDETFQTQWCKIDDTIVCKPQTYMNLSGKSVLSMAKFYKIEPKDIWVTHDDIDLPLGKVRIRTGGGSAGHRGIESIINALGNGDFVRFRLGIGRGKLEVVRHTDINIPRQNVEKYVISPFTDHEAGDVKKLIKHAGEALGIAMSEGIEKAMNRFN